VPLCAQYVPKFLTSLTGRALPLPVMTAGLDLAAMPERTALASINGRIRARSSGMLSALLATMSSWK
jgi:hypothetical protein